MKENFSIAKISKPSALEILANYHYLGPKFRAGHNYGLFCGGDLVGVAIFAGFPVPELVKGCFGLDRCDQAGFFELSRLCLLPEIQKTEHNITSWFLSRAIRLLREETNVRAILSYADADHHTGTIYRACNFGYYGLTAARPDFWIKQGDGTYKKHSRGAVKGLVGEWRPRSRKHRFLLVYDKKLTCLWKKEA